MIRWIWIRDPEFQKYMLEDMQTDSSANMILMETICGRSKSEMLLMYTELEYSHASTMLHPLL